MIFKCKWHNMLVVTITVLHLEKSLFPICKICLQLEVQAKVCPNVNIKITVLVGKTIS